MGSRGLPGPTSWNHQQISRRVTEPTNYIITRTELSKPETESHTLFKGELNSFSPLFHLIKVKVKKGLPCWKNPVLWSENDRSLLQLSNCAKLPIALRSLSLVCSTFQAHNRFAFINLEYLGDQLIVKDDSKIEAGILMPSELIEIVALKKRKIESETASHRRKGHLLWSP